MKCTKKQLVQLIEQYYQEIDGRKVRGLIQVKRDCIGYERVKPV